MSRRQRRNEPWQLRNWGTFKIKHAEHANEYGENVLYGAGLMQGRIQDASGAGPKILCADTPSDIQAVDIAVNKLSFAQKRAVEGWYCEPDRKDGRLWTLAQIATKSRTSVASFERNLLSGEKKVLVLLTECTDM